MDVREKLVEWLADCAQECHTTQCSECDYFGKYNCSSQWKADHLIEHGVTVQNPDGCEYCTEDRDGYRKANGAFWIAHPFHAGEWFLSTGHCKPRQIYFCPMCGRRLPQPPKGE